MTIQSALYGFLTSEPGVAPLVGNRVFPLVIPDQVYDEASKRPCIVYNWQANDQQRTFCGTIEIQRSRFAFDCYAKRYEDAHTLASAVQEALTDYRGPMGDVTISDVSLDTKFDLLDLEPGLFRVALSFFIWHAD